MRRPRTPARISESLHRQLNAYALAASAAGVATLALAQPSEAKIVYTKAHQLIPKNTHYSLDLNHDGITDFSISNFYNFVSSHSRGAALDVKIPHNNFVRGYVRSSGEFFGSFASAFSPGVKIKAGKKFLPKLCEIQTCNATMAFSSSGTMGANGGGQWFNATNRYLGFKFQIQGKTHYGWARLNANCANYLCSALLTGYAYETVANKAIITGKTKGPDVITVQPATLGHLAAGASAIRAWRKQSAGTAH